MGMKEQYLGDINDYRKYVLLRRLCHGGGVRIGVCWMLTAPDTRPHGKKVQYLEEPAKWRHYDSRIFDVLQTVTRTPGSKRLSQIEQSSIVPGAVYFDERLHDGLSARHAYMRRMWQQFRNCTVIFFDPDNGIEVRSAPKGRRNSSKYIYWDELAESRHRGHSALIYQHFRREDRQQTIGGGIEGLLRCSFARVWTFRSAHVVFLLGIHPVHDQILGKVLEQLVITLSPAVDPRNKMLWADEAVSSASLERTEPPQLD